MITLKKYLSAPLSALIIMTLLFSLAAPNRAAETAEPVAPAPLVMHFYFTPTCPLCEPAKQKVADAEKHFGARIEVRRHDHSAAEAIFNSLILALDACGRQDTPTQALFFGNECLDGDQILAGLIPAIEKALADGAVTPDFTPFGIVPETSGDAAPEEFTAPTEQHIAEIRAKRITLPIVLFTGFADGFNPCAFATVILFVSMLTAAKRERRTILAIGISFIIGVFLTYLALGVAFYQIISYFDNSATLRVVSLAIKWLALAMVAVAAVLSLIDFWRAWRSNGKDKMLLVLPDQLKNRIHKRLRGAAYGGSLIVGAFITGIVISLLEAACTGQTYLPVITGLIGEDARRGYTLLALYNVMFIIPLIAVFLLAFFGMTSEQIGNLARKKVWLTKLALAVVFIVMAIWLGGMLLPTVW
jgi:sulfite exporter TauE/SafE